MGPHLQRQSTPRFRSKHLGKALLSRRHAALRQHLAPLVQYAVATAPSPRSIPTVCFRLAILLVTTDSSAVLCFPMAGLPSIAPRVRFSLGAYRIPPRDRPSYSI